MKKVKEGDDVRLLVHPEDDINSNVKVNKIYYGTKVWISNLNMPYQGTISLIITKKEFEELTNKTF